MSHRLSAMVRATLVIAMLATALATAMLVPTGASAAQNDRGLIDESSYQSPQFGYSITWADPWTTSDRDVITNPGGFDTITLRGDDGTVRISGRADTYDPLTFLQDTVAIQLASGGDVINQDTTGAAPTAELLIGNEKMRIEVLSLPDAGAVVLVSLRADQDVYDAVFASAQAGIQIEGSALFGAGSAPPLAPETPEAEEPVADIPAIQATESTADVERPTEAAEPVSQQDVMGGGVAGSSYTSPNFGFSISWDPAIWTVPDDAEYSEPDYDSLIIESATGPIWVTGWTAYNGNASTCLLGEMTYYNDPEFGITDWQIAIDAEGNELTGETETSAWGVYTNTYTDAENPDEGPLPYVDYIECHSLGDGESVVIFYSFAEREAYNEHIANVLAVVETLELDDSITTQPGTAEAPMATATPAATIEASPTALPTIPATSGSDTPEAGDQPLTVGQTELTWTGNWQHDAASSTDEQVTLTQIDPATGMLKLASYGEFIDTTVADQEATLEVFADAYFQSAGASGIEETGTGTLDNGTLWKSYTFDLQGIDLSLLVTVSIISDDTFAVSTLTSNTDTFEDSIIQAQQEIMLDGEPSFLAGIDAAMLDEPATAPTPAMSPASPSSTPADSTPSDRTGGDTITGQTHAFSFTVPPGWQVNESSLGGDIETTSLTNGISTVTVEARAMTPVNLSACVSAIADEHETEPAYGDLILTSTASGDAFAGEDDFTAFANFAFTGPDGEPWAHFVECRWIAEGESVLVVTQDVPQELFGSERGARRQVQNSIEINP